MSSISFLVPTYNEVNNVKPCVESILAFTDEHDLEYEIIIIDSGSTDGTPDLLKSEFFESNQNIKVVFQKTRMGMGVALKEAYHHVTKDIICHYECDCPYNLEYVLEAKTILDQNEASFVLGLRQGDRYHFSRVLYTTGYRIFIKLLFGVSYTTINYSFKIFHTRVLKSVDLQAKGWFCSAELLINTGLAGFQIAELPVPYNIRQQDQSTVQFSDVFNIMGEALEYKFSRYSQIKQGSSGQHR